MQYQILATTAEIWQSVLVSETNDINVAKSMLTNCHPMLPKEAILFIYDKVNGEFIQPI